MYKRQEFYSHLELHKEKLKLYQAIHDKDFKNNEPTNRILFIHKMILELGIIKENEWIKWLQKMIPQLKKFEEADKIGEK